MSLMYWFLSTLGASFLEEIHCGYCDGKLCVFWEREGWRREAESTEEGKEAPRQDELQVIHPIYLSFCLSSAALSLCFSSQRHRGQNCAKTFFMSDKEMESRCYVHPGCPHSNTDELNLWPLSVIGEQNCKSICRVPAFTCKELSSKLLPWHCQILSLPVCTGCMLKYVWAMPIFLLLSYWFFKWSIKENQ